MSHQWYLWVARLCMCKIVQNTCNNVLVQGQVKPAFSFLCHRQWVYILGSEGTWHLSRVWLWRSQGTVKFEPWSSSLKCARAYRIEISFWKYPQSTRTISGYVSITHPGPGLLFYSHPRWSSEPRERERERESRNLPTVTQQPREDAESMVSPTSDPKFSVHSTTPQLCFIYRRITMDAKEIFSFLKKASSFLGVCKITLL